MIKRNRRVGSTEQSLGTGRSETFAVIDTKETSEGRKLSLFQKSSDRSIYDINIQLSFIHMIKCNWKDTSGRPKKLQLCFSMLGLNNFTVKLRLDIHFVPEPDWNWGSMVALEQIHVPPDSGMEGGGPVPKILEHFPLRTLSPGCSYHCLFPPVESTQECLICP